MSDTALPAQVPNEFRGTIGIERKKNLGNYEHEVISHFIQYEVIPGNEEQTAANANDAAFLAKSVVYSQLGEDTELEDGILKVKTVFPGAVVQAPASAPTPGIAGGVPQEAAAAATGSSTAAPSAPAASDVPVCPVDATHGVMYDNRPTNVKRKAEGKKAIPEARCRQYADPPKGQGCSAVVWSIEKGK